MEKKIVLIPGDGIGPEIVGEAKAVLAHVAEKFGHVFHFTEIAMGGCSIDRYGEPLTDENLQKAKESDAVLLGAVGGNAETSPWYKLAPSLRPEAGLLKIRKELGLFANLRPAFLYPELAAACPLKPEQLANGFDLVIVRELTGGLYFGERHTEDPPEFTQTPAIDELYGVIHVPSWNWMKIPLGEGTTGTIIDQGWAGHYKDTAQPGQLGNFSVAAHRRSYGNSFRFIDLLKQNDKVVVETNDLYLVYTYQSNEIVPASDETNIRVIAPVPGDLTFSKQPTERLMTMTTCNPEYGNSERFIVHLKLESWTPKNTGVPAELLDEPVE